jgi:glycosyltransferase involved in cell wall biosynthesis
MSKTNERKSILMVTRPICLPFDEASKNFAYSIAKNLPKFDFHLLTYSKLPPKIVFDNFKQHPIYTSPSLKLSFFQKLKLIKFLAKLSKDLEVLHFLFTPSKLNSFIIKKLLFSKLNLLNRNLNLKTIQTIATLDYEKINKNNVFDFLFAKKIITHSDLTKDFLIKLGLNNVQRIYPGIDTEEFKPREKSELLLEKLNLTKKDKIILYTGEYVRLKAIDLIIESLLLVKAKLKNFKLILACRIKSKADLQKQKEVKQRIKKMQLDNHLIYLETFSPMKDLYNLADLFIFPVKEMTGKFDIALTILEAMASGVPSILSSVGALGEIPKIKGSAVMLKKLEAKALANPIINLFNNKDLYNQTAKLSRENIKVNFDIKECVRQYEEVY